MNSAISDHPQVLYVDADVGRCRQVQATLGPRYRVEPCHGADQALTRLAQSAFPIVIADIQLYDPDAIELFATLKIRHPDSMRLLIMDAATSSVPAEAINSAHVFHCFTHPISLEQAKPILDKGLAILEREDRFAQLHRQLEQSEQRLRLATRAARIGAWEFGLENGLFIWDEQSYELFGLRKDAQPTFGYFLSQVHPDDKAAVKTALADAVASQQAIKMEYRVQPADGDTRHILSYGQAVDNGTVEGPAVVGVNIDISERKQAEQAIRELNHTLEARVQERTAALADSNAALHESEQRTQLLRDIASAGNAARSAQELYGRTLKKLCQYTGWRLGHIYRHDTDTDTLEPTPIWHCDTETTEHLDGFIAATLKTRLRRDQGLPGKCWAKGQPVWIVDLGQLACTPRSQEGARAGLRSAFAFPVMENGNVAAVCEFFSDTKHQPDAQLIELVFQVGQELGYVLKRQRAEQDLRHRHEFEQLLFEIATRFIDLRSGDIHAELDRTLRKVGKFLGCDGGYVFTFDAERKRASMQNLWQNDKLTIDASQLQGIPCQDRAWWNQKIFNHQHIVIHDIEDLAQVAPNEYNGLRRYGIRAAIDVPMIIEGEVIGLIGFCASETRAHWDETEIALLRMLGQMIANTHRREDTDNEIRAARDAAEAANVAKSAFLATMSHEIRTPMNGIVGMIELLQQSPLNTDQKHMIGTVRNSASSLLNIINDVLDFSKIEAGRMDLEYTDFSMEELVDDVGASLAANAIEKGVRIFTFYDPRLPARVQGDPVRVRQVLYNLMGNAIKFTKGNGDDARVVLRVERLAGDESNVDIRIQVADNGIGMHSATIDKLFTPFTQADSATTRQFGGTGLGLSISKKLLDMMEAQLAVDSTPGEGSTFTIECSFGVVAPAPPPQPTADGRALVVAAIDIRRNTLQSYLAHMGIQTDCADNMSAALRAVRHNSFELVVISNCFSVDEQLALRDELMSGAGGSTRYLLLIDHIQTKTGLESETTAVVRANPMRRSDLERAVAIARGEASPEAVRPDPGQMDDTSLNPVATRPERILVAEDNSINQDLIQRQLALLGFECDIAADGKQALAMWQQRDYELLLTDCHMPNLDGFGLTGAIRRLESDNPERERANIIAITANALHGESERCREAGMDDYLTKPVELPRLRETLTRWLGTGPENNAAPEPASPAVAPEDSPLDASALAKLVGDDPAIHRQFLNKFVECTPPILQALHAAFEAHSTENVIAKAHQLKSSARSIGAHELADTCQALENAGKDESWPEIEKLHGTIKPVFDKVATYISQQ